MKSTKPVDPLTLDRIRLATMTSSSRLRSLVKKVGDAYADSKAKVRRQQHECRTCFYIDSGGIVCRAFTTYVCAGCKQEDKYPSTGVPVLCMACAETYELCRHCCADLECRERVPALPGLEKEHT